MRALGFVTIVLGAGMMVGCTPAEHVPDPEVVWESEGTSPLEEDPAVVAVRAADLAWAMAWNARDFDRDDFIDTHTPRRAGKIYEAFEYTYVDSNAQPRVLPGPSIWLPLSVEEKPDGTIEVLVCDASDHWVLEDDLQPSYDLTDAYELTLILEVDGTRLVASREHLSLHECDATGAPVGRFDPAPVPPSEITSVVPPREG